MLFIGDIVGPEATAHVVRRVPELRRALAVDLVIANAENCAVTAPTPWQGFGMTQELVELLLGSGVDVLTSGNHGWDGPEAETVHRHPRVLRPLNAPEGAPGKGSALLEIRGKPVTILNLCDAVAVRGASSAYRSWLAAERQGTVIVDFHGDSTWEKMIFATAVDGHAAAVLGTHSHEPTINLHLLPGGTAFVADVGMTGPTGHPGGFPLTHFAAKYRGEDWTHLPPFTLATGPIILGAVLLRIERGKTQEIRRIT